MRLRWKLSERQRKFGRDVGSVVLGVLIALGIGEAVEAIRWRVRASIAVHAINAELARDAGVMRERMLVQACVDRRLVELETLVDVARRSGELPLVGTIGRITSRPIEQAAWTLTSGSETLLHIANPRRDLLAVTHAQLSGYDERVRDERQMWATVALVENAEGEISDDMLVEVAGALKRLRDISESNGAIAGQVAAQIEDFGIEPNTFLVLDREASRGELNEHVQRLKTCRPLIVRGQSEG